MGSVFSCLASAFIYLGEFLENVFLAIGEIGAVLVRAIIGIVVSLCDLLAAISCCYRVPWSERPDRSFYTYSTNDTTMAASSNNALATVGGKQVLSSVFTKQGREQRKQIKAAKSKAAALKADQVAAARDAKKAIEKAQKEAAKGEK
ncbi:Ribosomal DNA transcription factor [Pseudozyma hubeiensis]|nr:Ribosomal DNA transcription factor [Pseudozyma hubeiensis]